MDIIEIDAASHTGVDNVRENIIANAQIPPFNNKGCKVFVIDEVHMLSKSAFNALLKTLEEPPKHVIFILATTEIHKVPETIISRCQRFDFKKIPQQDIIKRLTEIIEWEKIEVPEHILAEISRKSEGCLRDAESLLGQIISLDQTKITDELASLVLPRSNWQEINNLVEGLRLNNLATTLNQINKLVEEGIDLKIFIDDLIDYLRQIMLYQIIGPSFNLDFADDIVENLKEHAQEFPLDDLSRLLNILLDKLSIKESIIDQLPLELGCVEFLTDKKLDQDYQIPKIDSSDLPEHQPSNDDFKKVQDHWSLIIKETKPFNHSLSAILQTSHPLSIDQQKLIIGLEYGFHLEQLDKPKVKNHLSGILSRILGHKINVGFQVDEDYKKSHQKFKGGHEKEVEEAIDTFGGEIV